jgi:hypothetical protein
MVERVEKLLTLLLTESIFVLPQKSRLKSVGIAESIWAKERRYTSSFSPDEYEDEDSSSFDQDKVYLSGSILV